MLRSAKELKGYRIAAKDGEVGKVHDFFVGDRSWDVVYMVAETGVWIPKRKVLLSPAVLGRPDWPSKMLPVGLTRDQIKRSPDIDTDMPVSMERKRSLAGYGWMAFVPPGALAATAGINPPPIATRPVPAQADETRKDEERLRSVNQLRGYSIEARDGVVGSLYDLILDDERWIARYAVVDTGSLLPGKTVILSPAWIVHLSWAGRSIAFDLGGDQIRGAPEYDPFRPVNREYEVRLYDYYGRPTYWRRPIGRDAPRGGGSKRGVEKEPEGSTRAG